MISGTQRNRQVDLAALSGWRRAALRRNGCTEPGRAGFGYLPQAFAEGDQRTLGQIADEALAKLRTAQAELERWAEALTNASDVASSMSAYDAAPAPFDSLGG